MKENQMKQVTILVPAGETNISSVMGTLEILEGANSGRVLSFHCPWIADVKLTKEWYV